MGLAMPGWSVTVLKISEDKPCEPGEIGRIAVKLSESPFAWFKGYIGNKEKSDEKFTSNKEYYLTGDTGRIDKDGYFYFLTRDDDIIIMAGYRIGPFEVEAALSTHDAVIECAVIAAPDEVRGEVIEAYVVLRSNQPESEKLTQSLQSWVKKKFAAHAYPRRIHYVSELPKNPSGKVQRFLLRDQRRAEIENEENLTNSIQ
jgi:acetyl-CoA synthetase